MTELLIAAAVAGWLLAVYLLLGLLVIGHEMRRTIDRLRAQHLAVYDLIRPHLEYERRSLPFVPHGGGPVIPLTVQIAQAMGVPDDQLPGWVKPGWGDLTPEDEERLKQFIDGAGGLGD